MAANNYFSVTRAGTQYKVTPHATNQPGQATSTIKYSSKQLKEMWKPCQACTTNSGCDALAALKTAATMRVMQQQKQQKVITAPAKKINACKNNIKTNKPRKPPRKPPKPQTQQRLYYCDVCVIRCSGQQSYQEHLKGLKHKKKKKAKAADSAKRGNFLCELCDVATTNFDDYTAHIQGVKHEKVKRERKRIEKLMSLKKTVVINTKNSATINKPPKVVSNIKLSTKATNTDVLPPTPKLKESLKIVNKEQGKVKTFSKEEDKGKMIGVQCKLCNCSFSSPKVKESQVKGIELKLQFKKKMNPDKIVGLNPLDQIRLKKKVLQQFWRRWEDKSWRDEMRIMEEERLCLEERRLCELEARQNGCNMIGLPAPQRPFPTEIQAGLPVSVTEEKHEIKRCKDETAVEMTTTNEPKTSAAVTLTAPVKRETNHLQREDGCEKDRIDTRSPLSNQEREDSITNAQRDLELFAIHHIYDVLGIDQLPPQRFSQKRRWDNSSEEGTKESAGGKRIKQEN